MGPTLSGLRASRNGGIDLLRGLLVLLVMLGHFAELTRRESFMSWVGIGFRMPLFIGLSGYLFDLEAARALSLGATLRKYYRRLLLPWLTACCVIATLTAAFARLLPWALFAHPLYYLWFVPVLLTYIVVARSCRLSPTMMLAIALPGSIGAMYLLGVGHVATPPAAWLPDRRYFIYPVYFALGLWVARQQFDPRCRFWLIGLAGIGFLWWCRLYFYPSLNGEVAAALLLCLPLIGLLPLIRRAPLRAPLIAAIGRDSLFFYLWHPLAFALVAVLAVSGMAMLTLAVMLILLAWALVPRIAPLASVLGLRPFERDAVLAAAGAGEHSLGASVAGFAIRQILFPESVRASGTSYVGILPEVLLPGGGACRDIPAVASGPSHLAHMPC